MKALLSLDNKMERKMEVASDGNNGALLALEDSPATMVNPATPARSLHASTPARSPLPLPSPSPDHKSASFLHEIGRSPALVVQAKVRSGLQSFKKNAAEKYANAPLVRM